MQRFVCRWNSPKTNSENWGTRGKGQKLLDIQAFLEDKTSSSKRWGFRDSRNELRWPAKTETGGSHVYKRPQAISKQAKRKLQLALFAWRHDVRYPFAFLLFWRLLRKQSFLRGKTWIYFKIGMIVTIMRIDLFLPMLKKGHSVEANYRPQTMCFILIKWLVNFTSNFNFKIYKYDLFV